MADRNDAGSSSATEPLACVMCRSRKLKCDRTKPACTRCRKVDAECIYPESRRKPTFKRRNVKEIEARLAQVESYLKEVNKGQEDVVDVDISNLSATDFSPDQLNADDAASRKDSAGGSFMRPDGDTYMGNGQLMSLGYSETLPPFEVQEELNNTFFLIPYHFIPIVHSGRYYQAFYGGPMRKPPMSLQYAIWAMGANGHAKYDEYAQLFYQRARQYAEAEEMKDHGEHFITVAHAQALAIIATFEAQHMLFTRASMSCAKAVRLCQMMGLDRLDGMRDDLPPALGPHTTWEELEERRRVFWGAFAIDSHASISTGWPTLIDAEDIATRLPASEEAFACGKEEQASFLADAFQGASYSGFAGTIVVCHIFRQILRHVHRSKPTDHPEDMMGGRFWKRHRELDNQLSSAFMFLPERFRLPQGARDPGAIHVNLNLHAAVIILHHAALEKAELHNLPDAVAESSIGRLRASAEEVVNVIKMSSHSTAIFRSPLCALSLYCTTTVYVYVAKHNQGADLTPLDISNFEIIIRAMEAIGRQHEFTCAFLQQAYLDIERNSLTDVLNFPTLAKYRDRLGGAANINVPLISQSHISHKGKRTPVLPGRLPLGKPEGKIPPRHLKMNKGDMRVDLVSRGSDPVVKNLINADCFQPVLGAVTRNVGAGPRTRTDISELLKRQAADDMAMDDQSALFGENATMSAATGVDLRQTASLSGTSAFSLPDRTSSATSSPAYRPGGTSDPLSGSSHTSPGIGLGNTPEENRVDLRPFLPSWQSTQAQSIQDTMFASSLADDMMNLASVEETAAALGWEPLGWDMGVNAGNSSMGL